MSASADKTDATPPIIPAQLAWEQDQPVSTAFGDIYHAADGPAEVMRVFTVPHRLQERFSAGKFDTFTIGELGFGSGLSIAVIAELFLTHAPVDSRLHIISFEKHPFTHAEFRRCAEQRRQRLPVYIDLLAQYPPLLHGWHRRHLHGGRIQLSLYFGDVADGLPELARRQRCRVQAWLLDGFAPDRNPHMWRPELFSDMALLADAQTTVATFTATGQVRRDLTQAGFNMTRIDQRPHKLHTLAGRYSGPTTDHRISDSPASVTVVGAGLSGSATAHALATRGIHVDLFETYAEPGNRITTLLHPRLSTSDTANNYRLAAYCHAEHWHSGFSTDAAAGVLQLPSTQRNGASASRLDAIARRYAGANDTWLRAIGASEASERAGIPLHVGGLFFPGGRSIDLGALCKRLRQHDRIRFHAATSATIDATGLLSTAAGNDFREDNARNPIVLCAGPQVATTFAAATWLEILPVWGQLEIASLSPAPRLPLVGDGYIAPIHHGAFMAEANHTQFAIGASYEYSLWDPARSTTFNMVRLEAWWKHLSNVPLTTRHHGQMRGVRAVTSDRLPIVGRLDIGDHDTAFNREIWVNTGHGSGGMTTIPLAAESIASQLHGEIPPQSSSIDDALAPQRFRSRQHRRGYRHGATPPKV